jgi:hypothetical protein
MWLGADPPKPKEKPELWYDGRKAKPKLPESGLD